MRLKRQKCNTLDRRLDMAAMIDVILLLLIFFMCTTTFDPPEKTLETKIAAGRSTIDYHAFEPIQINITKTASGVVLTCDGKACQTYDQLEKMLLARRAIADVNVIVRAQDKVPFRHLVSATDKCYKANLMRVGFSLKEPTR